MDTGSSRIGVRRSDAADAAYILDNLVGDARFTFSSRHGPTYNINHIIETSFLSVTAFIQVEEEVAPAAAIEHGEHEEEEVPPQRETRIVEKIIGFASFSDAPRCCAGVEAAAEWPQWIKAFCGTEEEKKIYTPDTTFWLSFMAIDDPNFAGAGDAPAASSSSSTAGDGNSNSSKTKPVRRVSAFSRDIAKRMLDTALATVSNMQHLLFALPQHALPFSPVCSDLLRPLKADDDSTAGAENLAAEGVGCPAETFRGRVFAAARNDLIPDLTLRQGRIEDYDDLMPLLLAGAGVVTPLLPQFRLEELLKNQDEYHQVVVGEDPATKRVVAVMCLKATYDQQQYVVKQYQTDIVGKLKPILVPPKAKGQQAGHNAFRISFFFLHPEYDVHAGSFVPRAFSLFPFAEYCFLSQPHQNTVHPVLHNFVYFPIKKLQPSTLPGESIHLPEGLFVCCRYSFEKTPLARVGDASGENGVAKLLATQSELTQEAVETIQAMAKSSVALVKANKEKKQQQQQQQQDKNTPQPECFTLTWREMVVGVVAGIRCTVDETFALRANFTIDDVISFEPYGDHDCSKYAPCDIAAKPFEAPRSYYKDDMPGFVIKGFYVRPVFREKVRYMLRETLRLTGTEVLYVALTPKRDDAAFAPLLQELTLVRPRRVAEVAEPLEGAPGVAAGLPDASAQVDDAAVASSLVAAAAGVMTVRCASRRLLSDEKTIVHARVVVVGASTTGLSVLHTLLHVPYLHFSNLLLISTDGMPPHPSTQKLAWSADSSRWTEREFLPLTMGNAVRVVTGSMVDVDRVDKCVFTNNPMCEPYDHLVLAVGRQYSLPKDMQEAAREASANAGHMQHADGDDAAAAAHLAAAAANSGVPSDCGIFVLNGGASCEALVSHIRNRGIYEDEHSRVVVYGSSLDVYAIVSAMLSLGMAPQRVFIVSPNFSAADTAAGGGTVAGAQTGIQNAMSSIAKAEQSGAPFGDVVCSQRVETLLESLGVQKLGGFGLKRLDYDPEGKIRQIVCETPDGQRTYELDATMLIYAAEKDIDAQVLSALNKRSIVFDGRVIVENTYRTTDRDIYAAGPIAMFSRRFGPSVDFDVFDPAEVGEHLAKTVLGCLGVEEFVHDELVHDDRDYVPKDNPLAAALGYEQAGDVSGAGGGASSGAGGGAGGAADANAPKRPRPLPKYNGNLVRRVRLPGGISFFSCTSLDYATVLRGDEECEHLSSLSLDSHLGAVMPLHGPPTGAGIDLAADEESSNSSNSNAAAVALLHDVPLAAAAHESGLDESSYFCVTLGPTRHIERVLYLGTDRAMAEMPHLCNLVGMSEATFNLHYAYMETKENSKRYGGRGLDVLRFFRMVRSRPLLQDGVPAVAAAMRQKLLESDSLVQHIREELLEAVRKSNSTAVPEDARRRAVALMTDPKSQFRKMTETLLAKFLHDQKQFSPQTVYLPDIRLLLDSITGEPRIPEE